LDRLFLDRVQLQIMVLADHLEKMVLASSVPENGVNQLSFR